ncbi:hypothetical protein [Mycoplasma sp. 3398]
MMDIKKINENYQISSMFTAIIAAFFAIEIINFNKGIIKMNSMNSWIKNIILGGICNATYTFKYHN